jgi:hypothetical protein
MGGESPMVGPLSLYGSRIFESIEIPVVAYDTVANRDSFLSLHKYEI